MLFFSDVGKTRPACREPPPALPVHVGESRRAWPTRDCCSPIDHGSHDGNHPITILNCRSQIGKSRIPHAISRRLALIIALVTSIIVTFAS